MEARNQKDLRSLADAKHGNERDAGVAEWFRSADDFNKMLDQERRSRLKRVKIAILDTGIDMTNQMFDTPKARARLKKREDFLREDPSRTDAHDLCGHGSHCAGLLRRVAPAADIFVARVAKDFESDVDPRVVAKAIERARKTEDEGGWDVDIITMSFGYSEVARDMVSALGDALNQDKIVFAAASNSGIRKDVAYPAWDKGVVCINSASSDGLPSSSNPQVRYPKNFAILGENVPSAWIASPAGGAGTHATTRVMSGSSMATPIAAALVSLLLEVAMNPGRPEARHIFEYYLPSMRKCEGVEALLSNISVSDSGYMVINANRFFEVENRLELAYTVRSTLRSKYGVPRGAPGLRGEPSSSSSPSTSRQQAQETPQDQQDAADGTAPPDPDTQPSYSGPTDPGPPTSRAPSIRDWAYHAQPAQHTNEAPSHTRSHLDSGQVGSPQAMPPRRVTEPAGPLQQEPRPGVVKSHSAPVRQPAITHTPAPRLPLFYTLTDEPKHLLPDADTYWRYMTPAAYEIYEQIYQDCKDKSLSGKVHYTEFTKQFIASLTPPGTIKAAWARLLRDQTALVQRSRHPKGLVMATLYMLHLESYRPYLEPLDKDRCVGVSIEQRSLLKGFANWVPCQCGRKRPSCSVEWNFVNDVGMHRGGDPEHCLLAKFLNTGKLSWRSSGRKEKDAKDATLRDWEKMTAATQ